MSPKYSSLAFDEVKEQNYGIQMDECFEPQLNLLVNERYEARNASNDIVKIVGRITISF